MANTLTTMRISFFSVARGRVGEWGVGASAAGDTSLRGLIGFDSFVSRVFVLPAKGRAFAVRIKTLFSHQRPSRVAAGVTTATALNIHDCG